MKCTLMLPDYVKLKLELCHTLYLCTVHWSITIPPSSDQNHLQHFWESTTYNFLTTTHLEVWELVTATGVVIPPSYQPG